MFVSLSIIVVIVAVVVVVVVLLSCRSVVVVVVVAFTVAWSDRQSDWSKRRTTMCES